MWCLCLSCGPSRVSVVCSSCVQSPSHLGGREPRTLSFQTWATVDISTQHFQASSCCFLLGYLDFPPSTCVVQESAGFESLCANMRAPPPWLRSLWNFRESRILSLTLRPTRLPFGSSASSVPGHMHREVSGLVWVSTGVCSFFRGMSIVWFLPALVPLQGLQETGFIFCLEFVLVTGRKVSLL